ncbi:hypothetical protein NHX12_003725 [Muraenolepis orangiensis]|uniref:Uncharacterized protein n=1 Tax=Muraenolepis orangiensis TaxID=630683 RepID=A0A9Q0IE25_9TELE|nr:hypothetical protein NHX12_003725 [Muraenolepis orangiensis]
MSWLVISRSAPEKQRETTRGQTVLPGTGWGPSDPDTTSASAWGEERRAGVAVTLPASPPDNHDESLSGHNRPSDRSQR